MMDMSTAIKCGSRVRATFQPQRTDDLKPEAWPLVGKRFVFEAALRCDPEGPYAGQWECWFVDPETAGWVPECDLADIEVLPDIEPEPEPVPVFRMPYDEAMSTEPWRASMSETRPGYILASHAQALDAVQELIRPDSGKPWVDDPPMPTREQWDAIVTAAFPPPPMA